MQSIITASADIFFAAVRYKGLSVLTVAVNVTLIFHDKKLSEANPIELCASRQVQGVVS